MEHKKRLALRGSVSTVLTSAALFVTACSVGAGGDAQPVETADVALETVTEEHRAVASSVETTEKGCTIPRSDVTAYITIGSGSWGSWQGCYEYCPAGTFAYTVALRSEPTQGSGDDTAMNGIKFQCYNRSNGIYQGYITSNPGYWGDWLPSAKTYPYTVSNPIVGGKMKIESPQGDGDDTAANAVQMKSKNGVWIQPDSNTAWGSWNTETSCPSGTAVCGVNTRVESQQGSGDDTALNGVALACCSF